MEDQILALTADVAAIKSAAQVTNTMFAEMYYYVTIPLMVSFMLASFSMRWALLA